MKFFLRACLILLVLRHAGDDLLFAQKLTVSGYVKDQKSGEALIGANVYLKDTTQGITSNLYGFYSLSLNPGSYHIIASFIGYQPADTHIVLVLDAMVNFELTETPKMLKEVVIQADRSRENVTSTEMSTVTLTAKSMEQIPVAFGEADALKILSLLPGVKTMGDGSSALSVRGGARDQNMILLDEATVYNANHLGNLLSVFNNDAIQNIEFYKGNIPAQYGGRLSSLIDIRMKEGNNKQFAAAGGIGILSSRLTLEGPIVKEKGSFMISGRRAYIDLLTEGLHAMNGSTPTVPYYFYDLNLKVNYSLGSKDKIYLSGYFGSDDFKMKDTIARISSDVSWGNYTGTMRWNSILSGKVFSNLTLLASDYHYDFVNEWTFGKTSRKREFEWIASLKDYSLKYDVDYFADDHLTLKTGLMSTYHRFDLGNVNGRVDTMRFTFTMPKNYSLEHAVYAGCDQKLSENLSLNYGLRYTLFQNIGKAAVYALNSEYETIDTVQYGSGNIFNYFQGFEPRIALTSLLDENSSLKLGYSRTSQYVHIASNSSAGSLIDIWIGSGPNIKPQYADLYSAGYFRNFFDNEVETSLEVYYKDMRNLVEFKEFAQPQFNQRIDEDFRFGVGRSYGIELFLKKSEGRLRGWISYTYSKTEQKTEGIQQKGWYPSPFDRTHDLSIVGTCDISESFRLSSNFTLKSGRPFTSPVSKYEYEQTVLPYFVQRNNDRMPLYHRLDLSLTYRSDDDPGDTYHYEIVLSVYDAYNRTNPLVIYFKSDDDNQRTTKAYKQNFLGLLPSLTWNFSFN